MPAYMQLFYHLFLDLSRHLLPLWRTERGGGLPQPKRHEPSAPPPPLEADLLLWPSTPGLCTSSLVGQGCQQESCAGCFLLQGQGEHYKQTRQEVITLPTYQSGVTDFKYFLS